MLAMLSDRLILQLDPEYIRQIRALPRQYNEHILEVGVGSYFVILQDANDTPVGCGLSSIWRSRGWMGIMAGGY